ncbi:MAG TPA: mannose-6-phosphate isomerase, class I [Flavisolibacter sp.]|jgi:mannose-6-phosphate isomerase|nr:mannose-6-phosphate isomerase, class I [Flavisolibacter sp.]
MDSIYKLRGVVQPYSWGGTQFIPDLIEMENEEQKPFAEYWLGAHPNAPAHLINGKEESLYDAIQQSPQQILGNRVQEQFGTLPYLLKVLDVRQMLSIQVHPSIESAVKGYAEENAKGIPLQASNRNYKDQNHKPELMAALSDFWLLHGFKSAEDLKRIFQTVPELQFLEAEFNQNGYKGLYETVMTMPQDSVDSVLLPLVEKILPQYKEGMLEKSSEHFWAARAVETFCKDGHYDRGIFSIYFFNLLHLKEGEGIYQPAGLPHAYLEGQNVEVMANSDNVLRAGLTEKYIDVAELMKHVRFEPTIPAIIPAGKDAVQVYETPAAEFELRKINLVSAATLQTESATIFFVYEGAVDIKTSDTLLPVKRGEAALVIANQAIAVEPEGKSATVFAVTTPVGKK